MVPCCGVCGAVGFYFLSIFHFFFLLHRELGDCCVILYDLEVVKFCRGSYIKCFLYSGFWHMQVL